MSFTDMVNAAADQYAAAATAAATADLTQQIAVLTTAAQADQSVIAGLQSQLAAVTPGPAPAAPPGWVVAFQDDFTTDGAPDPTRWAVASDYSSNELSVRTPRPANVTVAGNKLTLRARREKFPAGAATRDFTSGYVTTAGKFSAPFGRFLIRARWDDAYGAWPAIWGRFDGGLGEIDIAEAVGTTGRLVQTVHQSTNGDMDKLGYEWPYPAGWSPSAWHVYGLERRPDGSLTWSVDGRTLVTRTVTNRGAKSGAPMTWLTGPTFTGGLHLIINLQVGGSMPNYYLNAGLPVNPATILPGNSQATLEVDWVQILTPTS